MRWRIYYEGGATWSDRDSDPFGAPPAGVIALAIELPAGGFLVQQSREAYFWKPETGWCPCDLAGLWDYLLLYRGPKAVLFGRSVRDAEFWETVGRATREGFAG